MAVSTVEAGVELFSDQLRTAHSRDEAMISFASLIIASYLLSHEKNNKSNWHGYVVGHLPWQMRKHYITNEHTDWMRRLTYVMSNLDYADGFLTLQQIQSPDDVVMALQSGEMQFQPPKQRSPEIDLPYNTL